MVTSDMALTGLNKSNVKKKPLQKWSEVYTFKQSQKSPGLIDSV